MERENKIRSQRMNKLLELMKDEDYYVGDFILCVCANLLNKKEDTFNTSLKIGNKIFEIQINRRTIQ